MTPTELEAMLSRDRNAWQALTAALEARPDEPLHAPGEPPWTARDIYNHVRRWMDHGMDEVEARLAGRPAPEVPGAEDDINARWQAEDSHLSHAEARDQAQAAYARRERVLRSVRPDQWDAELETLASSDGAGHHEEHRLAIVPAS